MKECFSTWKRAAKKSMGRAQTCRNVILAALAAVRSAVATLPSYPSENPAVAPPSTAIITRDKNSELVNLGAFADPPSEESWAQQVGCPHAQAGLINWHDASLWPGNVLPVADGATTISIPDNTKVRNRFIFYHVRAHATMTLPPPPRCW